MKKFIISILIMLITVSPIWAGGVTFGGGNTLIGGGMPSGVTYGCPTCLVDLRCEDNAASTVVTNSGTGAAWVAGANTDTLTSTEKVEGSRSFLLQTDSTHYARSPVAYTFEKFEVTFYMKLTNATPGASQIYWQINSDCAGTTTNSNSMVLYKPSTADTIVQLYMKGYGGTAYTWQATNFTNDTNWHKYTITVNASTAPWTSVVVLQDTTTLTWDISTYPTAAAEFGRAGFETYYMCIGAASTLEADGYFDVLTVKDNT